MNEQEKYGVIKRLVDENGNKLRAAQKLNLSVRQINRLIAGYKKDGKAFFVHDRLSMTMNHKDCGIPLGSLYALGLLSR